MDSIVVILGDSTEELSRTLKSSYGESVEVTNYFKTPTEFAEYYASTPLRVKRIIINENSFQNDMYTEISNLKKALESFYIIFDRVYFLTNNNPDTLELLNILTKDETFPDRDKIRVYPHDKLTAKLTIDYCLNKISRKFYQNDEPEFDEIVRKRKDSESTFKLEDDNEDIESDIVVLDKDNVKIKQIQDKLRNLNSLSTLVKDEKWEDNKILKDLYKIEQFMDVAREVKKYDIDQTDFFLAKQIRDLSNNIIITTGERRSGKTTLAYSLAKSASNYQKVLLVDFDTKNLGLSHLAESVKDPSTVMLLQDFKTDFKNSLRTLVKSSAKFNMILSNSKTLKQLDDIDPLNFLSLIVNTCAKYYDKIIFDIPMTNLNNIIPLMKRSDKVIVTVPTQLNTIISSINILKELDLTDDLLKKDLIFVPVDIFNPIKGIKTLERNQIKGIIELMLNKEIPVLAELTITSFKLDQSLFKAVEASISPASV